MGETFIRVENMEDGTETFFRVSQEQWETICKLKEIGALKEDFSITEFNIELLN